MINSAFSLSFNGKALLNNSKEMLWQRIIYEVTTATDGNGTITASPMSGVSGTNVTLSNTPNSGYTFSSYDITGDIKIVVVAAILYLVIWFQRKDTKSKRDEAHDELNTRVVLLEQQLSRIEELDLASRLASIETSLKYIQMLLEEKRGK